MADKSFETWAYFDMGWKLYALDRELFDLFIELLYVFSLSPWDLSSHHLIAKDS